MKNIKNNKQQTTIVEKADTINFSTLNKQSALDDLAMPKSNNVNFDLSNIKSLHESIC